MKTEDHAAWERRARTLYQRHCQKLSADCHHELTRARQRALARQPQRSMHRLLLPAGAMAASVMALGVGWGQFHHPEPAPRPQDDKATLVQADAAPDLYQHLDFYVWLASTEPAAGRQ